MRDNTKRRLKIKYATPISFLIATLLITTIALSAATFQEYPQYVSKDGTPFTFQACFSDLDNNTIYDIKAQVARSDSTIASDIWNRTEWIDSSKYAKNFFITNSTGQWCGFINIKVDDPLEFDGEYNAYLGTKVRKSGTSTTTSLEEVEVNLLDMCTLLTCDTWGGTDGGWVEAFYPNISDADGIINASPRDNIIEPIDNQTYTPTIAYVKKNNKIISMYTIENNSIEEGYNITGFTRLAVPDGTYNITIKNGNYTIQENFTSSIDYIYNTVYLGNVYYLLISSTIGLDENLNYTILNNKTYNIFRIENLEYTKILNQNLEDIVNLTFSWNITKSGFVEQGSKEIDLIEIDHTASWTPREGGQYEVCGAIVTPTHNSEEIYNLAPKFAAPEQGDYGHTYCFDLDVLANASTSQCTSQLNVTLDQTKYQQDDDIIFSLEALGSREYEPSISWWIEDSNSKTIKRQYFKTTINSSKKIIEKSWSPKKKTGTFKLKANISEECDTDEILDEKTFTVAKKDSLTISAYPDFSTYNSGDNATIFVDLISGIDQNITGNISVKIKRTTQSSRYYEEIENRQITITANGVKFEEIYWDIPNNSIKGEYKILAKFIYEKTKSKYAYVNINGVDDLGEPYTEMNQIDFSSKFGDFINVPINFFSKNLESKLKFIAYLYKPGYAAIDTTGNTMRTHLDQSQMGTEINIERGQNNVILLPLFLNRNCDNKYNDNTYKGKVRIYQETDGVWKKFEDRIFHVSLNGRNDEFCQPANQEEQVYISSGTESTPKKGDIEITIDSNKSTYSALSEIEFNVTLVNTLSEKKEIEAYSYIFNGSNIASEGGWTGNKINVTLEPKSQKTITLSNKLKDITGIYTLRARAKYDTKNEAADKIVELTIAEILEEPITQNQESEFLETPQETPKPTTTNSPTGFFTMSSIPTFAETLNIGVKEFASSTADMFEGILDILEATLNILMKFGQQ